MAALVGRQHDIAAPGELGREIALHFRAVEIAVNGEDGGRRMRHGCARGAEQQGAHGSTGLAPEVNGLDRDALAGLDVRREAEPADDGDEGGDRKDRRPSEQRAHQNFTPSLTPNSRGAL